MRQRLLGLGLTLGRVGLERPALALLYAGGLVEAPLPAICVEIRHMHARMTSAVS